jgi:hypothetical protein
MGLMNEFKPEGEANAVDFTKFRPVANVLAVVMFVAVVVFAGWSVYDLFVNRLGTTSFEGGLAVIASVGVAVVTLFVALTTRHAPVRGLGAIVLIAWTLLVLVLVGLNSALRGGLFAIPEALSNVGQVAAGLLAALALVPAITIPLAMNDRSHYDSAASAASKYVGFLAKGAGVAASAVASAYFGISRGINPMLAVICGVVLESCFLWAYLKLIHSKEDGDVFDTWMWAASVALFGAFIAAVSIETLSTLAGIRVPIVAAFGELGATLYVSAVGLSVILTIVVHILTSVVNMRDTNGNGLPDDGFSVSQGQPRPAMAMEGTSVPTLKGGDAEDVPARRIGEVVNVPEQPGDGSPADTKS